MEGNNAQDDGESLRRRSFEDDRLDEHVALLPTARDTAPTDKCNAVYVIFYLLGMATLLPWNFFLSIKGFWDYRFRDVNVTDSATKNGSHGEQTELQTEFYSYLAIASMLPTTVFLILNVLYGHLVNLKYRIFVSLGLVIALFFIMMALSKVDSDSWQREFLVFVLILVSMINACTAVFQGSLFGESGKFPERYMGAMMSGQSMGGIFPALVSIFVTALNVDGGQLGFVCFLIATLALVASFLSFSWIRRKPFFRYYSAPRAFASTSDFLVNNADGRDPLIVIVKRSWIYCLSVSMLFTVTIAIFPAILVLVESQSLTGDWGNVYFTLVTCFLLFNVGDYVGRSLACLEAIRPTSQGLVLLLSGLRVAFVPIFLYCNAAPGHRPESMPVLIESDSAYIAFVVAFAISNGFLANVCMILGPKTSTSSASQEATGMILVACLSVSCSLGSVLSYPLIGALGGA